ncbi:hypothetical protein Hanom_Chr00s000004g01608911 [Helianthus anomalus]
MPLRFLEPTKIIKRKAQFFTCAYAWCYTLFGSLSRPVLGHLMKPITKFWIIRIELFKLHLFFFFFLLFLILFIYFMFETQIQINLI